MADVQTLFAKVTEKLSGFITHSELIRSEITIEVAPSNLHEVCLKLRDDADFNFQMLIDVCGVDYLQYGIGEWQTESATATGFERGVDQSAINLHNHKLMEAVYQHLDPYVSQEMKPHLPTESEKESRFAVVYHLLSLQQNHRIRVRAFLDKYEPKVTTVMDIWPSANWFEREAFDLFGIIFYGHPDLRRILTDYGFVGHPFRKDFPLSGKVEVRYDAALQRIVYEPVSIVPRILEPKVIRHDNRYQVGE